MAVKLILLTEQTTVTLWTAIVIAAIPTTLLVVAGFLGWLFWGRKQGNINAMSLQAKALLDTTEGFSEMVALFEAARIKLTTTEKQLVEQVAECEKHTKAYKFDLGRWEQCRNAMKTFLSLSDQHNTDLDIIEARKHVEQQIKAAEEQIEGRPE